MIDLKHCMSVGLVLFASAVCWAQKPELVVQTGHSKIVSCVAFSPDGKLLASGSQDRTIKLWDVTSGLELLTLKGHTDFVSSVAFAPDGKVIASGSWDNTVRFWDAATGSELRVLKSLVDSVTSISFSPQGTLLAVGGRDGVQLFDVGTSESMHVLKGHTNGIGSVAFSPNGKQLVSASLDQTIKFWDVMNGTELHTLRGHKEGVRSIAFSSDGHTLASADWNRVRLWNVDTFREEQVLKVDSPEIAFSPTSKTLAIVERESLKLWNLATGSVIRIPNTGHQIVACLVFSPDGNSLAASFGPKNVNLWSVIDGKQLLSLRGHADHILSVDFSSDGRTLASAGRGSVGIMDVSASMELQSFHETNGTKVAFSSDGKLLGCLFGNISELWDVSKKELVHLSSRPIGRAILREGYESLALSPRGTLAALAVGTNEIRLWDFQTDTDVGSLRGHRDLVRTVTLSPDGNTVASGSDDETVKIWSLSSRYVLRTLNGHSGPVSSVAFSPDGKTIASASDDRTVRLWDVASGAELRKLQVSSAAFTVMFSPDGSKLAALSRDNLTLWKINETGFPPIESTVNSASALVFMSNSRFLITAEDGLIRIRDVESLRELVTLIAIDEREWVVVAPDGHFDASPGAQKLMCWRVGAGLYDIIVLDQLKERYYEPGLLQKIFGSNKEPLRDVTKFENPKLNPDVQYEPLAKGSNTLTVSLTNRGGGIGRVQVFLNGKEFLSDARDDRLKQNPNVAQATLNIDLSKATGVVTGKDNNIRVVAWNVENYISSRGADLVWTAGGPTDRAPPEVYAIIGGISNYSGSQLNLNFAAKDAVDIANAIELGAKRLFGADKVHLTLLSTADDPRAIAPTKDNFTKAFEAARKAKPTDILIVYLAGHGITLQRGSDTYCYLTQEARTTDTAALSDSAVRKQETITSEELVDWIKQIPALKQVVMLDTCAAGAAQAQLKLVDKREASGDAIRAIDRAKDRTGSYILMGSAADAVSYEASQYGQGLLTYALLKGMKGAALNNDEFIDIAKLFQYAREEVEQLAKNIGGIQRPIIFAPKDDSFEVGQLNNEDKLKIYLATPKPMILRPRFLDAQADDDTLDLMKVLRARLRDESFIAAGRGANAPLIFVDDEEFPGGIRPTGRYTVEGNKVTVTLRLRRDGVEIGNPQTVTGSKDDVPGLAARVLEAVKEAIKKL